jgi:hypothetical protein
MADIDEFVELRSTKNAVFTLGISPVGVEVGRTRTAWNWQGYADYIDRTAPSAAWLHIRPRDRTDPLGEVSAV